MRLHLLTLPLALIATGAAPAPDERRILLTGFDQIRIDGPFEVRVVSGQPPSATVTGDRRGIDRVSVRNQGGVLVISPGSATRDGWGKPAELPVIAIGTRELRGANINGGGRMTIDRMSGQRVVIGVNGAGSLTIARLDADQLGTTLTGTGAVRIEGGSVRGARFMTYGAGSVDAGALSVNDLTVHSQSAGDGKFRARFTAAISNLGSGSVRVEGNATCRMSGPGPASCAGKTERR